MEIPKIIHCCWLSDDPYPPKIQACIDSWKKYLPDYEVWIWNFDRFPIDKSIWVKEAFEAKKYAFAADFLRFYAVYNYGGIYLDCDVEVVRSFDPLLRLPYFISLENMTPMQLEPACFGAVKETAWVGDCLKYYEGKRFVKADGSLNMVILPDLMKKHMLKDRYTLSPVDHPDEIRSSSDVIYVLKREFSFSYNIFGRPGKETYAIHHYDGSWMPQKTRLVNRFLAFVAKMLYQIMGEEKFHRFKGMFRK